MEYLLYIAAGVLGILFRYDLRLMEACKIIGVQISSGASETGFQEAIAPPSSTHLAIVTWALIVALLLSALFVFGWSKFGVVAGTFLVMCIVSGASFIPKPDSPYYVRVIYRSMVNRYADYEKQGDRVRSDAMKKLIDRVEQTFGEKLYL
jgi:hypothetical protein